MESTIEQLQQERAIEEEQLKKQYPGYELLKIDYSKGTCLLGNVPLLVNKFYDIVRVSEADRHKANPGGVGWENVFVERTNEQLTPSFVEPNYFTGQRKRIALRGDLHGDVFLMKPNTEIAELERKMDREVGWGSPSALRRLIELEKLAQINPKREGEF